ncbi:2-hydroxy-3-oxopropionate reductase [Thiocapsa imhoffii]|uniref:2-hydroxy-3-oxopropionate reductase n=1 Tax=Thiocapsa imhoffii TaxID=382777 RepID=A0A9X0WFL3_9GAMM|nr:2-hydroxy-3-oxopropionate reductase [Thiocapsa imhoffii]MBK1643389.1 2-hydroxy-3-oxopropionate reductase [Thiocapsa imhoffii]
MNERIGFIGLGIMGKPMALNLMRAGYALQVYARRPEALHELVEAGATPAPTPAAVARDASVIFTMVADTPDVEAVILGEEGILAGARPGSVVVDMSTIAPSATRRISARLKAAGIDMLDAPVSGGDAGARAGTLSIMVGGALETFERVRPLLQVMGKHIVHVGGAGAGQVCKACNQIVVGATIAGVAEAITLAQASGVDATKVREALLGGFASSRILEVHGLRMIEGDYAPGFKSRLHHKDMGIVLAAASELEISLEIAERVSEWLATLVVQGCGDLDSAALFELVRPPTRPRDQAS